jgi:hypothetical protein
MNVFQVFVPNSSRLYSAWWNISYSQHPQGLGWWPSLVHSIWLIQIVNILVTSINLCKNHLCSFSQEYDLWKWNSQIMIVLLITNFMNYNLLSNIDQFLVSIKCKNCVQLRFNILLLSSYCKLYLYTWYVESLAWANTIFILQPQRTNYFRNNEQNLASDLLHHEKEI